MCSAQWAAADIVAAERDALAMAVWLRLVRPPLSNGFVLISSSLRSAVIVITIGLLAACGGGDTATDATVTPATPTAQAGTAPPAADDSAGGGIQPATVALSFDGQPVPIVLACNGADGAVLVTTEGEVTVTLVQEDGLALRYSGEGLTAETSDVEVEEIGVSTVYRGTVESDAVPAVDITLELGDTSVLDECQP